MPETDYKDPLGDDGNDQMRVRFLTVNGQVTRFTVQYETRLAGEWAPVIRYDNAHGSPDLDRMNRGGEQTSKEPMPNLGNAAALTSAIRDILKNWQAHRERFESE